MSAMIPLWVIVGWVALGILGAVLCLKRYIKVSRFSRTDIYLAMFAPVAGAGTVILFLIALSEEAAKK